jgi:hypothetical protein
MGTLETKLTKLVQDIIGYIEELEDADPAHHLLQHSDLFEDGTAPTYAEAKSFYLEFVPEDGTREDTLVEYLAALEDAVMTERANAEDAAPAQLNHRLHEVAVDA